MSSIRTEYQLSPRKKLTPGDPVKIEGKRGLFRFVHIEGEGDAECAQVVGPIGKSEALRLYSTAKLRSAGAVPRERVAMSPALRQLSSDAKKGRRS